ncbi:MAG: hypothetical protein AB8H03_02515 [Saprospiraceae bacterium]
MKSFFFILMTLLSFSLFQSCETEKKPAASTDEITTENLEKKDDLKGKTSRNYKIKKKSFQGISIGDNISEKASMLTKEVMQTGEGDFVTYEIKSDAGEKLAFVMPDPRDPKLVGDITIISPNAMTSKGVRVGMTLGELKKRIGELTVHGSEIESRTSVAKDNFRYRLDAANNTYEIDQSKVSDDVKILEITIY